jgi:hypothetical protein
VVPYGKPLAGAQETEGDEKLVFEHIEDTEDADLLPVTNIGFRC